MKNYLLAKVIFLVVVSLLVVSGLFAQEWTIQSNSKINDVQSLATYVTKATYLKGGVYVVKDDQPQTITFNLNPNTEYVIGVKGENVTMDIDGLTIETLGKVTIKTDQKRTVKVNATTNKKGKIIVVLSYVRKLI
jgi:hypothetical protein